MRFLVIWSRPFLMCFCNTERRPSASRLFSSSKIARCSCTASFILSSNRYSGGYLISYVRKPQAFKPGDEWHPFEAKPGETWRSGADSDMIWLWPNIRLGPIRNTGCSTTWYGYRSMVGVYCEAKYPSARESCCMKHAGSISGGAVS